MHTPNPSIRAVDPMLALVAALVAYACALALAEPGGRVPELAVAAAAAAGVYAQRRVPAAAVWAVAAAMYLLLELAEGRLTGRHYWWHIATLALLAAIVAAAALAARRRDDSARALAHAAAEAQALRAEDELAALLGGGRATDAVEREVLRSRRHEHAAGVLLIRPDEGGTRELAAALGGLLRTTDAAFAHGDAICVLLPETEPAGARAAGERLRLALVAAGAPTVSIGAASFPEATSRDVLLDRAADALERARQLGGNRTVASFLPAETPPAWRLAESAAVTPPRD